MMRIIFSEAFNMVLESSLYKGAVAIAVIIGFICFIIALCSNTEESATANFFYSLLAGAMIAILIIVGAFILLYLILVIGALILGLIGGILGIALL